MENSANGRLEVKLSRWQTRLVAIFCLGMTALGFYFYFLMAVRADVTGQIGMTVLIPTVCLFIVIDILAVSFCLRGRPLLIVDDAGITDCGFYSQGYGLMRWENIENVTPRWMGRAGLNLFVEVNNFDELLSKRHPLMQPTFMMCAWLNLLFGAQINLPIGWGDTDIDTIRANIARYSKNKILVPNAVGPLQSFFVSLVIAAIICLIAGAILGAFSFLHPISQHK